MTSDDLLVLVGPTAVGKSAAALALAARIGGEIVSVDSRCVYRRLDIGTAKPTLAERIAVPHHLIDLVDPDEEYSVATFLRDGAAAIAAIRARGRRPIVAGGTGYWVRALLGGPTSAAVPPNPALRAELAELRAGAGTAELVARLRRLDPAAAEAVDRQNPRRIIRAIEVVTATGRPYAEARLAPAPCPAAARIIGLTLPRDRLDARIAARYDSMVAAGWVDEVRALLADGYRRDLPSMSSLGYAEIAAHVAGELTLNEALARANARCRRFARGQYNWFRLDDPTIAWLPGGDAAPEAVTRFVTGGER